MVINTKQRCVMCREQVDKAYFRDNQGNTTDLCARCQKLMKTLISSRNTDEIAATAKAILTSSGMSAEQIVDLVSPTAAADNVVMKAIGMDVFNNRIKPANVIPGSKLAGEVIGIPAPGTTGEFKFGFTGMIGFDDLEQPAQQPIMARKEQAEQAERQEKQSIEYAQLERLYRDTMAGTSKPPIFRQVADEEIPWNKFKEASQKSAKVGQAIGLLKNIDVPAEKAPARAPEPPAEIGRVARAIAGEDEE